MRIGSQLLIRIIAYTTLMKQLLHSYIFITCFFFFPFFVSGMEAQESYQFSITGEIDGLMPNDTIAFLKVTFPYKGDEEEVAFSVIVNEPSKFFYSGEQPHAQFYRMNYRPASGRCQASTRRALSIIVEEGDYRLKGEADFINFSTISGGLYDNSSLRKILHMEDSLEIIRTEYLRVANETRKNGDMEKAKEYVDKFNSFHINHQEPYALMRQKVEEFMANNPSSTWTIVESLQRVSFAAPEKMRSTLSNMDQKAQNSYYGQMFRREVEAIERLAPGNEAPLFSVITTDGKEITSDETKGKYLLLYQWGLCPGSFSIDKQVTVFYEKYKEHLSVIGITDNMETICEHNKNTGEDDEILGIRLKPVLENMVAHPWPEVESAVDNHRITEDFAFGGLPYFVFISPEGKIISRGFYEAFDTAQKIMKSKFDD